MGPPARPCGPFYNSPGRRKNVQPNDLKEILKTANIRQIFVNGKKAETLYKKYIEKDTGITAIALPSTSPANAAWSEDRLFEYWNNAITKAKKQRG